MNTQILWYASRATGAVSLVLFTAVMVLGIATAARTASSFLPRAGVLRLHRSVTVIAMTFLAIHIVTAIADGYVKLNYWDVLVPFGASWDPIWVGLGSVAVDLLLAIGISSALRRHLSVRVWRGIHLASYVMWPVALFHGLGISGGDGTSTWMIVLDIICVAAVVAALIVKVRSSHPDSAARSSADVAHPREQIGISR